MLSSFFIHCKQLDRLSLKTVCSLFRPVLSGLSSQLHFTPPPHITRPKNMYKTTFVCRFFLWPTNLKAFIQGLKTFCAQY